MDNSRRAILVAENWAAKAQAAISAVKAHEAEHAAAGSGAFSAAAGRRSLSVLFFIELALSRFLFLRAAHPSAEQARGVMKCSPSFGSSRRR